MSRDYDDSIELPVTHMGVDLYVKFDYTPEEIGRPYGDTPEPGYPEEIDILEVLVNGVNIAPLLDIDVIHSLQDKVLEQRGQA